ncbi:MAG: ROK family protein [Bacteroidales bacterium]|nr:ROK family protein [Bacteroidales bacterium]
MSKVQNLLGIDIGGTKCAVIYGVDTDGVLDIVDKIRFDTTDKDSTVASILEVVKDMCARHGLDAGNTKAVGISCGGPLDSTSGVVMSPPNLPGWDNVPIVNLVTEATGIRAYLQNDANACALAEWKYGAGRGTRNMVFLTFGTGMGAGLIIDGKLYSGTNDNAGEVGHIRLSEFGPVGYGKAGSMEGFASGGGIAQIAATLAKEQNMMGHRVVWCPDGNYSAITAKSVAEAARDGDELAKEVYRISATYLGRALSVLIDILNPEAIVIGSIFVRAEELIRPYMQAAIDRDSLPVSASVCKVKPAELGERIGDMAALSIASSL